MNPTEQLPMAFSSPTGSTAEPIWLGIAIDHRRLFDALQDEWLCPPQGTEGQILGVRTFIGRGATANIDTRITARLKVDPTLLPRLDIPVYRDGKWTTSPIGEVSTNDEAIFWPGVLPTFAIAEALVATREEQARLSALARQVSNIPLPSIALEIIPSENAWVTEKTLPTDAPEGIVLPQGLDAIRGAMAMALWAVPRIDPWLHILTESLALLPQKLPQLADAVGASWWAWPPWFRFPKSDWPTGLQELLWLAATQVFRKHQAGEPIGTADIVREIVSEATRSDTDVGSVELSTWAQETMSILRADATIRLDDWKTAPVGKAIQLVLVRPEPTSFKTWFDDLPSLPPSVWWSAATLCGLLNGYRRMDLQFRGEAIQRRVLSVQALRMCTSTAAAATWPGFPTAAPKWRRKLGHFVFSWGETDFAKKTEPPRGKWFSADMEDQETKRAAEELAQHFGWPCVHREILLSDDQLLLSGDGKTEVIASPSPRITVHGSLRIRLPPRAAFEKTLDVVEFRYCIATEGGANIPAPPSQRRNIAPHRALIAPHQPLEVPGLHYVRDFISEAEEEEIVATIDKAEWMKDLQRRVQHYGWRYDYKARQVDASMRLGVLPPWAAKLAERLVAQGLVPHVPDQVIVNEYVNKQGISRHVDCVPCFADGIATLSLLESWEIVFKEERGDRKVPQLLERRSVAIMTGDARYRWSHEIPKRLTEPNGVRRGRRISVTFRKVNAPAAQERSRR